MELKGHLLYYPEGKHDINLDNYVQKSQLNDALKSKVDSITKTTYADLKNLRDNSQLVPGSLYRITDYNCTTTQENTRSAGHQFDIVLLALSENKLAEEGWAMEHPTDVWDIQLHNGVVKKGYLYFDHTDPREGDIYNIVIAETLMGFQMASQTFDIDKENKIINLEGYAESNFDQEGLTYSYFQNSNLSAWKVWYCLDNDTDRFAWADDSISTANIVVDSTSYSYKGTKAIKNVGTFYEWEDEQNNSILTESETPSVGDDVFTYSGSTRTDVGNVSAYDAGGVVNGRGVIYRLIDEWNNDVGYDFKNIQFIRPMTDGEYDPEGEDTWVYTYSQYDSDNNILVDTSLDGGMMDGFIGIYNGAELSNNVIFNPSGYSIKLVGTVSGYCTISGSSGLLLYNCDSLEIDAVDDAIYIAGKKVLTEE